MNRNILIVLGGAILAAVLVAFLVQITLGNKDDAPVENGIEVLVAAKDLKKGTELSEGDLKWKEWPEGSLFKGAIKRTDGQEAHTALEGRIDRSFSQGEAVVRKAILKDTKSNFVAARLNSGERAVSIKVSAAGMVAGFIVPGSYVDVILTYKQRINIDDDNIAVQNMIQLNLDSVASETILENIRVLAIDQKADRDDDEKIKVGKIVTLAVPIRQAERLALATEMGDVSLALRGVGDDAPNPKAPASTDARMTSIDDEIFDEYQKIKESGNIKSDTLRIYNGSQVIELPVQ